MDAVRARARVSRTHPRRRSPNAQGQRRGRRRAGRLLLAASDVVVEVDGYRFHNSRRTFEADRSRDTRLQISGRKVIRVTYRRIAYERETLTEDLRELLGQGRLRRSRRL